MHSPHPDIAAAFTDTTELRLGDGMYRPATGEVSGEHVTLQGEPYVLIRNVDLLAPFFMSVVSNSDLWIFAGSNSPFTAGRSHPDAALFPYQTADKILQHPDSAGAMTTLFANRSGKHWSLWEPWRPSSYLYKTTRNLYKHACGGTVVFEEINHDLGLRFRWTLTASEEFGLVRECELTNLLPEPVAIRYLDGLHNLLPAGVNQEVYSRFSYLAAAYMRHERPEGSVLGIYTLNSLITDRAEPAESLKANCAWSLGHANPTILLSSRQIRAFCRNEPLQPESEARGEFGAYLVADRAFLESEDSLRWVTVADAGLDHASIMALQSGLEKPEEMAKRLQQSVQANLRGLRQRIASADGLQHTADKGTSVHHFANVLFNCMRGGVFAKSYSIPASDFGKYLRARSTSIHARHAEWLAQLPRELTLAKLDQLSAGRKDVHLTRLVREYLPLTFSRRHGDPSRPWNRFAIRTKNAQGEIEYGYQGNWRDIFQNWEGLASSYPEVIERMIAVFLNASSADGYNPYRIMRNGVEWESPNPDDPWSHIGYWGDHQLVYLLRLLQACEKHYPGRLASRLGEQIYASVRIPYEIRPFEEILRDPHNSIHFNAPLHASLVKRAEEIGNDAKLLRGSEGDVLLTSLAEKLLVPLLAKLSNLVPDGGIWMNTQRPDWNDANNALVGWGLSMVTTCQMAPYIRFLDELLSGHESEHLDLSTTVATFAEELSTILKRPGNGASLTPAERYEILEALGRAGEKHRRAVYEGKPGQPKSISIATLRTLLRNALLATDATIRANRRTDGMYQSYNLLKLGDRTATIDRLPLMLEGQVAVLSSRTLPPDEALWLLRALRSSELYRQDQQSYMLYPNREIRPFLERNTLPKSWTCRAPLLLDLIAANNRDLVFIDQRGGAHFQADITNAVNLNERLDLLARDPLWTDHVERERATVTDLWEEVFEHRRFMGRSGSMFAFEGLGSIYWHMVAKLLLAVQENYEQARRDGADTRTIQALGAAYLEIRRGLGFTKTPQVYGAFPSDPYSHSPGHRGAQQPGMTGQVKEEILTRWSELGVTVERGTVRFAPRLLSRKEFFTTENLFSFCAADGSDVEWKLPAGSLGFTYCQTPVCYRLAETASLIVERDGHSCEIEGNRLSPEDSAALFSRRGSISRIVVNVPRGDLRPTR